jgi:adenylosuccinate lyase
VRRSRERLQRAAAEVAVGQISGAVGTHASVPPSIEEHVCTALGLGVAPVTTQVVARDRHASLVTSIALLGAVLERVATTVRLCQQTDVGELEEPFSSKQRGSSAMPHKRNPVLSERIVGLARVLRGYAMTALDDVALWHERDISHSSAERVILPDSVAVLAYMLRLSTRVVNGIRVDEERMLANVERDGGIVFSQPVLTALIGEAGWSRDAAYRTVQGLAARARAGEAGFRDLVSADDTVKAALTPGQLDTAFAIENYLAHIDETFRRLGLSLADRGAPGDTNGSTPAHLAAEAGLGGGRS